MNTLYKPFNTIINSEELFMSKKRVKRLRDKQARGKSKGERINQQNY